MKTEIVKMLLKTLIILAIEVIWFLTISAAWGSESDVSIVEYYGTSVQDDLVSDAADVDENDPTPTMTPTPTPTPTLTPTITPTPALHPEVLDFYDDVKKEIVEAKETEFKIMVSIWALAGLLAGMKIQRMVFG